MPNLLIATLGGSWQVIPEILGHTNPDDIPIYEATRTGDTAGDDRSTLAQIDEVWVITTDGTVARGARAKLERWQSEVRTLRVRIWWPDRVDDVRSVHDSQTMADLIYRVVLHAHDFRNEGSLYLSLAGGRKTMSAEMQQAGRIFGCDAMLHVVDQLPADRSNPLRQAYEKLSPQDWSRPLPADLASSFHFVPIAGHQDAMESEPTLRSWRAEFPLPFGHNQYTVSVMPTTKFYDRVMKTQREASNLRTNYALQMAQTDAAATFRALYLLPPQLIDRLRRERIGIDSARRDQELAWIRSLPKAELHCHLGGILSPADMIDVARSLESEVGEHRRKCNDFDETLRAVETAVGDRDQNRLLVLLGDHCQNVRAWRTQWPDVPEPLAVAGVLQAFHQHPDLLDESIYGSFQHARRFRGVGFSAYEQLGDLQGSGLLQSRQTLRAALAKLGQICRRERITYLELRCSPINYTRGGLNADDVVDELLDGIEAITWCDVRLIFIGSRHRSPERLREHVELAERRLESDERFQRRFVAFDIAGDESSGATSELRQALHGLRQRVVGVTIHAGENQPVSNIWEAVYELSADRIGHGLTLNQHPELRNRFRERRIAIEMCPSSNQQIVDFQTVGDPVDSKRPVYPLREYLEHGLRVCVNTDNPGISRTTLSREFLQAAAMTPDGLTRWQVLQLIRNSFQAAFSPYATRRERLVEAEKEILQSITKSDTYKLSKGD